MTDQLRVGVIGVGWGSMVQVPAFRAAGGYEVAALCSRRAERVAAAGERAGHRGRVHRLGAVRPPARPRHHLGVHADRPAPRAGARRDRRGQARAVREAGRPGLRLRPRRWPTRRTRPGWPPRSASKTGGGGRSWRSGGRSATGLLGSPYFARVAIAADYFHPTRPLMSEWMYRLADGGGYLLGMASHDIDYLYCLFGVPEAVCADVRATIPRADPGRRVRIRARTPTTPLQPAAALAFWCPGDDQPDHDGAAHRLPVPLRGLRQRRDRGD